MALTRTNGGGGGGGGSLTVKDEGSTLSTAVTSIDVVGPRLTATNVGGAVTLTHADLAWVANHPDSPPTSPTTFGGTVYDIEFMRDQTLSGHTVLGSPATTPSVVDRALRVVSGALTTADIKGVEWACPGSAFTMTAKVRRKPGGGTFGAFGPMLRRNASGAGNIMALYTATGTIYTATNIELDKYTALTARSSAGSSSNWGSALWLPYYMQLQYDGTNIIGRFSFSGFADSYLQVFSETAATFLGGAPGRFGIVIDNFGTSVNTGYCEWIRFT